MIKIVFLEEIRTQFYKNKIKLRNLIILCLKNFIISVKMNKDFQNKIVLLLRNNIIDFINTLILKINQKIFKNYKNLNTIPIFRTKFIFHY